MGGGFIWRLPRPPNPTPLTLAAAKYSEASPRDFEARLRRGTLGRELIQGLDDRLGHLLGVAEQHHRVVGIEQRVVDAGVARRKRPFHEQHRDELPLGARMREKELETEAADDG